MNQKKNKSHNLSSKIQETVYDKFFRKMEELKEKVLEESEKLTANKLKIVPR